MAMKTLVIILIFIRTCDGGVKRSGEENATPNSPLLTGKPQDASTRMSDGGPSLSDEKTNSTPIQAINSISGEAAQNENVEEPSSLIPRPGYAEKATDSLNANTQGEKDSSEAQKSTSEQESLTNPSEKPVISNPEIKLSPIQNNRDDEKSVPNQNTDTLPVTSNTETTNPDKNVEGIKIDKQNIMIPGPETTKQKTDTTQIKTEAKNSDIHTEGIKLEDIPNIMMPGPVIPSQNTDTGSSDTEGTKPDLNGDILKPSIMMPGPVITKQNTDTVPSDTERTKPDSNGDLLKPSIMMPGPVITKQNTDIVLSDTVSTKPDLSADGMNLKETSNIMMPSPVEIDEDSKKVSASVGVETPTNSFNVSLSPTSNKGNKEHSVDATKTTIDESIALIPAKDMPSPDIKDAKSDEVLSQTGTNVNPILEDESGKKYVNPNILMPAPVIIEENDKQVKTTRNNTQLPTYVVQSDGNSEEPFSKQSPALQETEDMTNFNKNSEEVREKQISSSNQIDSDIQQEDHDERGNSENGPNSTPNNHIEPSTSEAYNVNNENKFISSNTLIEPINKRPESGILSNNAVTGSTLNQEEDEHDSIDDLNDDGNDVNERNENENDVDDIGYIGNNDVDTGNDDDDYEYTDDYEDNWWEDSDDDYPDDDGDYDDDDDYTDESIVDLDDIAEEDDDDMTDDVYDKDDDRFGEIVASIKDHEGDDENDKEIDEDFDDDEDDDSDGDNRVDNDDKFNVFKDKPNNGDVIAGNIFDDDSSDDDGDMENGYFGNELEETQKDKTVAGFKDIKQEEDLDNKGSETDKDGTLDEDDSDIQSIGDMIGSDGAHTKSSEHDKLGAKFRDDKKWREMTSEVKRASVYSWVLFFAVICITLLFVAYINKGKVYKFFAPAAQPRRKVGDEEKNLLAHEYD